MPGFERQPNCPILRTAEPVSDAPGSPLGGTVLPIADQDITFASPEHWARVAAERGDDDRDSALDVGGAESTASMTSSILAYRNIHGRTYHSEVGNAEYWATNDALAQEMLDILLVSSRQITAHTKSMTVTDWPTAITSRPLSWMTNSSWHPSNMASK